jgi:hypothetical protein
LDKEEGEILYEEIETRIKEEAELKLEITAVNWFSVYKVHSRHVERFSSGRCFLAGDSAHIHTPAGGQGMNTGIQDVYNLAWKLAFVLKHSAPESILDTYNEERLPNAKRLLETTDRMFNLAAGSDWFLSLIRTTVFPVMAKYILSIEAVRKRFFLLISQLGINYRDGSLSMHDGDHDLEVKAGDRMPWFLIDGKSIFDELRAAKFHLLTFSAGDNNYQQEHAALEKEYGQVLDLHVVPLYPHVTEIFGVNKSFNLLLRPDNYIGFISPDASLEPIRTYFGKVRGVGGSVKPGVEHSEPQ